MNCLEFRRICSAEPGRKDPDMTAHLRMCADCSAFAVETESFDQLLVEALSLPVPQSLQSFSLDAPRRPDVEPRRASPLRWLAVAASLVVVALAGFGAWRLASPPDLGAQLVAHVLHEPGSLLPVNQPVAAEDMERVLRRTGARFDGPVGTVTYMKTCPFRDKQVAHVVIEGSTGPVTLMLLPDVKVATPEYFDEEGLKGVIVPVGEGSVAIIAGEAEPLAPVEKRVSKAVSWRI